MRESELKQSIMDEFLGCLADPRVERTRKHSLETILVVSLLAVICWAKAERLSAEEDAPIHGNGYGLVGC